MYAAWPQGRRLASPGPRKAAGQGKPYNNRRSMRQGRGRQAWRQGQRPKAQGPARRRGHPWRRAGAPGQGRDGRYSSFVNLRQEIFIASRYFRARHENAFIVIVSRLSMVGVALGVATLIVVLAVMNGFERELRARILDYSSHIVLIPGFGYDGQWAQTLEELRAHPQVSAATAFARKEVIVSQRSKLKGAVLYGIIPADEDKARAFGEQMKRGDLNRLLPGEYGIVIGQALADDLFVDLGDKLLLMSPVMNRSVFGLAPRSRRFEVRGIFSSGMNTFDENYIYAHQEDVSRLLGERDYASGLRVYLDDADLAVPLSKELIDRYGHSYFVRNWTEENQSFFRAIQIEKRVMSVILALIIAVAVFNVLSSLVMLVSEKRSDIAILRATGFSKPAVMRVFMYLSVIIGAIGTIVGVALGLVLAFNVEAIVGWIESVLHIKMLAPDVYIIDEIPSDTRPHQIVLLTAISMALSLVASLYPAWSAASTRPAEILRHD